MVAVFGRSGCGKTTLLNAVGGLDRIASGNIEIFGQDIREDTDTLRNKYMGYIFQNYNLNAGETVLENVATALRLCGMEDQEELRERSLAALRNVGMEKYRDRTPDTLSGGQQQRVAIARALVKNPAIILADEPTGNLDEQNTILIMDILKQLSETRLVLLVTHEAHLVDHYCDRVIEIVDGAVTSDKTNAHATGYVTRDPNHVYLGELEKTQTDFSGVTVEYYGASTENLTIRVVNHNGKLYVSLSDPSAKLLDDGSEIRLLEGIFEESVAAAESESARKELDMSRFAPFEGKTFGRLFHWGNSLGSAWRENFRKDRKKGKGLLRACLFLLAVVMVFMTASFGASIQEYTVMRRDHNQRLFYVPLNPEIDLSVLNGIAGKHGVAYARIIGHDPLYDVETLEFRAANFMSAENVTLTADARPVALSVAQGLPLVAGVALPASDSDVIITTALAEKLLDTATVSYLREPEDLIGMVSSYTYRYMGNIRLRIAGVVESDELFFYLNDILMARYVLEGYFSLPIVYASREAQSVKSGEILLMDNGYFDLTSVKVGDTVTVLGKEFTVGEIRRVYDTMEEYPAFVRDTYGKTVAADPAVYAKEVLGMDELTEPVYYEWLLEHYFAYMPEFYDSILKLRLPYDEVYFEEWQLAKHRSVAAYASVMNLDALEVCGAYLYKQQNGVYPTAEELDAFTGLPEFEDSFRVLTDTSVYQFEFDRYMQDRYNTVYYERTHAVISDEDYMSLAACVGRTDELITPNQFIYMQEYGDGTTFYSNHLMLRSTDAALTEAYLTEVLGRDGFFSPENIFDRMFDAARDGVAIAVISILAVLALMSLCIYFIMRASFMSRVREVGVLRAIGVTKRNLLFRFAVETGLLLLLTAVPGYLISALFIASLSDAALFSTVFFFPVWMGIGLLTVIALVGMLFGILPAAALLRKTPSEILSKYDI
jgi:ABC-type lipoprotein export system ATPase subunit